MMFQHLDEDSGAIGVCRSPRTCKREWHYLTVADAQEAFEESMRDLLLPVPLQKEVAR